MTEIKWKDDTTIVTCLNVADEGTTLESIAAGAIAVSDSTGDLDNGTELDLFADFELAVTLASAPGRPKQPLADLYILPSVDGTNFPTGSTAQLPDKSFLAGTFVSVGSGIAQRAVLERVVLRPRLMRFLLHMHQALADSTSPGSNGYTGQSYTLATNIVTVDTTAHGLSVDDWIGVGSSPWDGLKQVATTPTADSFTFAEVAGDSSGTLGWQLTHTLKAKPYKKQNV